MDVNGKLKSAMNKENRRHSSERESDAGDTHTRVLHARRDPAALDALLRELDESAFESLRTESAAVLVSRVCTEHLAARDDLKQLLLGCALTRTRLVTLTAARHKAADAARARDALSRRVCDRSRAVGGGPRCAPYREESGAHRRHRRAALLGRRGAQPAALSALVAQLI